MRNIIYLVLACFLPVAAGAADFKIKTTAKQKLTGERVPGPAIYLLPESGNDTIHAMISYNGIIDNKTGDMTVVTNVEFTVPKQAADYMLYGYAEGFKPVSRKVHIGKPNGRQFETIIPDLIFDPVSKQLSEVTVTASKVKFYVKGDTIVYNADAFQTSKGSMLDALIRQLPGVELRDNGQIYVNGRFVENLVMNGKDFFKGDNNIMLNNLGAYTVKDVAVYDKWSDRSMLAGQDIGDSQFTMDVRLKKEYMSGYIGNLEAGAGTDSRYLGRLFGMWYTVKSRVTLVGNINNLNDSRKPGQNDNFKANNSSGDVRTKMAGLNYSVDWDRWNFSGNTTVEHNRTYQDVTTYRSNFLTGGDTYETRYGNTLSHALKLITRNGFDFKPDGKILSVGQTLSYEKNDLSSTALSGSFNREMRDITREMLEHIYSGSGGSLNDITINSALTRALTSGSSLRAGGGFNFSTKLPDLPDLIELAANCYYTRNRSHDFNQYGINFYESAARRDDYTYTDNTPDHNLEINIRPSYQYLPSENVSLGIYPGWKHKTSDQNSDFYRLDRLEDAGVFGILPTDYSLAKDAGQSHRSRQTDDDASLRLDLIGAHQTSRGRWSYQVSPHISYAWQSLDYEQMRGAQHVTHNSLLINFYNTFINYRIGKHTLQLKYERNTQPVSLARLVTITDTRDPLNIFTGATGLKNAADNNIELRWIRSAGGRHGSNLIITWQLNVTENALVNGYSYDETTGIRQFSTFNVSGNRYSWLSNNYSKSFGRRDQFYVGSRSMIRYTRAADMISSGGPEMTKSTVDNFSLAQALEFNWTIGRQKIGLSGRIDWRDTRSDNPGFTSFSATSSQFGLTGLFELPHNFGLSTDLNVYTRRGYAYRELNTTDVVWNARLSYSLKGGSWLFMLDGFDLLHQLSNVTYNVNAQGRTETFTNVLPRYALLHIQYRFAIQPKKR